MASILVTGADGFIGNVLVATLKTYGHQVHGIGLADGDISDMTTLNLYCEKSLDAVFHLAGRTFVPDSWTDPVGFFRVNVSGTVNILEFCRKKKIPLTFVSAYVYGVPESLPIMETDMVRPNNPYALSKRMAEEMCQFYATHYDVPVTVIRPFNIYGPGQSGHFLIPEVINQVMAGRQVRVLDLRPRRDYLYVDDLVDGLTKTLDFSGGFRVFNMGSGSSLSVGEIVDNIQAVAGTKLPVHCEKRERINELLDVYADIGKAKKELGWTPNIGFREGISKIIAKMPITDTRNSIRS